MTTAPATLDIPKNPAGRRAWIGYQLEIRGLSFSDVARDEGVSRQAVSASAGGAGSSHLRARLAEMLGVSEEDLFPEHYDQIGRAMARSRTPARRMRRSHETEHQDNAGAAARNDKGMEAA